jgi:hypothetical protein
MNKYQRITYELPIHDLGCHICLTPIGRMLMIKHLVKGQIMELNCTLEKTLCIVKRIMTML